MKITFNSWLRSTVGTDFEEIEVPKEVQTIADLAIFLGEKYQPAVQLFENPEALRYIVNRHYVQPDYPLKGVDLVAIYPPITGG